MSNNSLLLGWRKRWNRSLLRFLGKRVRVPVDVDDLAQETYLRLLRSADLSEVRHPQAYLLKVAGHVVSEWRDRCPPTDSLAEINADLLVDDSTPEFEMDMSLSQERLNRTLSSASPTMRAVLLMRLRDERPYKEIAEQLGITHRQVRRHLERGYHRLRQTLEN